MREAQARVTSSRNVSEDRLEEFVAEEAMKAVRTIRSKPSCAHIDSATLRSL